MTYHHHIRVRYGECDMQQVVFNAHYFAYIDDAVDTWLRTVLGPFEARGFDVMLKRIEVEWRSPARFGDVLDLAVAVVRWGRSSFDVFVTGAVAERAVFEATIVYISTVPGEATPTPVPDHVRTALGATVGEPA